MADFAGTGASETFTGGSGGDSISGAGGSDTLNGGGGDDVIYGESSDLLATGAGDTINGGDGNDVLIGGAGSDFLAGGAGDDIILLGNGHADRNSIVVATITASQLDTVDGGDGNDRVYIAIDPANTNAITANISNPAVQTSVLVGGVAVALLSGVEQLVLSSSSSGANITGGALSDVIAVRSGTVSGGGGDDQITFGVGGNPAIPSGTADGGDGFDRLTITGAFTGNTVFTLRASGPSVLTVGGVAQLTATNFEAVTILVGGGDDVLTGGAGDDSLNGGMGVNTLDGGAGIDTGTASFSVETRAIAFDNSNASGVNYIYLAGVATSSFTNIEKIVFNGGFGSDTIIGGSGDDVIFGNSGDDILDGGAGNDTVSFFGTLSPGVTYSLAGPATQNTGDGTDTIRNFENVTGSGAADTLTGDGGANILAGNGGADVLNGAGGDDVLYAGSLGVQFGHGFGDADTNLNTLNGGDGNDTLYGAVGADTLNGGDGDDILRGGDGHDTLNGGNGNDSLDGGDSTDMLDGGAGIDEVSYRFAAAGVIVNLGTGSQTAQNGTVLDTFVNIENAAGSAFGDSLIAGAANAVLDGGAGNDVLQGGAGADTLIGGSDADMLDGGAGQDRASFAGASAGVTAFLGSPSLNTGDAAGDVYTNIEILQGSDFADILGVGDRTRVGTIEGSIGIEGGGGNDIIFGTRDLFPAGQQADYLFGQAGDDTLEGLDGADYLDGGDGIDTATFADALAGVSAYLDGSGTNAGEAAGDIYTSIENLTGSAFGDILSGNALDNQVSGAGGSDILYGRAGADVLDGGDGNDTLDGGADNDYLAGRDGNDTLVGGAGNDVLEGGAGADAMDGGAGIDVASYRNAGTGVYANMANSNVNGAEAAGDTFANIENLWGSDFDDALVGSAVGGQVYGFAGNDTLVGQAGNDVFYGGAGTDWINTGGGADDIFFLRFDGPSPEGGDNISDFTHGVDHITVSRFWFGFGNIGGGAAALTAADADFITSGTTASAARPTFFYNPATGALAFDPDGTGAAAAVTLATLQAGAGLTLSDIWTA